MTQTTQIDRATLLRETITAAQIELQALDTAAAQQSRMSIAENQITQVRTNIETMRTQLKSLEQKIKDSIQGVKDACLTRHNRQKSAPGALDQDGIRITTAATDMMVSLIMGRYRLLENIQQGENALKEMEANAPKIPAASKKTAA
jgi:Tfp pilus assembly protein PilN